MHEQSRRTVKKNEIWTNSLAGPLKNVKYEQTVSQDRKKNIKYEQSRRTVKDPTSEISLFGEEQPRGNPYPVRKDS